MASAKKLPSGAWRCRPTKIINEKKITKSFTVHPKDCANDSKKAKKLAERQADDWLLEAEEQISDVITVEKAIDLYIQDRSEVLSPSTIADYMRMKKHFNDILNVNIFDIDTKTLQATINEMAMHVNRYGKRLNDRTLKNRIFFLLAAFSYCGNEKTYKLRFPAHEDPDLAPPEKSEFMRLLECAESKEQKLILMLAGLYTLRRGEICALKGADILWDMHSIYVHSSRVLNSDKEWISKRTPKTSGSVRTIQIDKELMELFPHVAPEEYIVKINPNEVTKMFMRLRKKACVSCRFHDLRKYAASIRSEIMPQKYVESDGGWKKGSQILKTIYDKPFKESRNEYSKKFNKMAQDDYGTALLG